VRDRIVSFLDPRSGGPEGKGWPFGRDVFGSELIEQIEAVDGVDYITDLMLTGACLPDDVRCVAATRLWHAEGDPIGLALGRDHLPLPRQAAGAVVVAPETVFVRAVLEVTLTALASADAASLKREAKTAIRQFFHPLYNDTGPRADVRTDLLLAVLAEELKQIADVENLSLSLKADAARLLIEDGETIGLRIEPGELVNWRVSVLVQPPQVQAPGDQ
jgi:hypothetical protein